MEKDRVAAGGAIDTMDSTNPLTVDFNRLHNRSVDVEMAILAMGVATVALIAAAESVKS